LGSKRVFPPLRSLLSWKVESSLVPVDGGSDVVAGEGLLDERGEVGVAAVEKETVEGLVLDFEFEALGAVGEGVQ
jgi:hypothetical protein